MAKKSPQKAKQKAGKPAPKTLAKAAKKAAPATKKPVTVKSAKKTVASKAKPAKAVVKKNTPVAKAAPKIKKPAKVAAPKKEAPVAKPVPAKPVKPAPKAVAPAKPVAPPAKSQPATPAKSTKAPPVPPPAPIDTSKLPKLPKGIIVKRGKGKLAPGEKRLVKTDVITHHVLEDKPFDADKKQKPEPKGKFTLEFVIRTPVSLLYDFLSTPNGLAEWFADGVDMREDVYTFDWDGSKQQAKIVSAKVDSYLRLRWLDKPENYYFEFRLDQDELTNEVSLIVTDFGDNEQDIEASRRLWESQIQRLIKALGTY